MMEITNEGGMCVVEPMVVRTKNSAYKVEPIVWGKHTAHKITKIEGAPDSSDSKFPVGWSCEGEGLFLVPGCRMVLGTFFSSPVLEVAHLEPHQ